MISLSGFAAAEIAKVNYTICDALAVAYNRNIRRYGKKRFMQYLEAEK